MLFEIQRKVLSKSICERLIDKAEKGIDIPSDIQTERDAIRTNVSTKEGEINALTTKASVLKYNINL